MGRPSGSGSNTLGASAARITPPSTEMSLLQHLMEAEIGDLEPGVKDIFFGWAHPVPGQANHMQVCRPHDRWRAEDVEVVRAGGGFQRVEGVYEVQPLVYEGVREGRLLRLDSFVEGLSGLLPTAKENHPMPAMKEFGHQLLHEPKGRLIQVIEGYIPQIHQPKGRRNERQTVQPPPDEPRNPLTIIQPLIAPVIGIPNEHRLRLPT
jgi:hypothetical protein